VPDLTDIAYLEPDEPQHVVSAPGQFYSGPMVAVPPQLPTLAAEMVPGVGKAPTSAYRTPILLGLGSVAMMLFAAQLWPRSESPSAPASEVARGPSLTSAGKGTAGVIAMPALTRAAVPAAKPASASSDAPRHEVAVMPLPPLSSPVKEPDMTEARRAPADWILAVHPPAAGPAKKPTPAAERLRTPPSQPRPRAAAPPECTPQVDALGLCEPGTKVTGR
jgi:hypothetical protein